MARASKRPRPSAWLLGLVCCASTALGAEPDGATPDGAASALQPATPPPAEIPPPAAAPPRRELARQWFEAGVSLAREGRYAAAKAMFLEAYAEQPHPLVLYNIAQAELQLGELAPAADSLQRYLDDSGQSVSTQERAELDAQIARIRAEQAAAATPPAAAPMVVPAAPPEPAALAASAQVSAPPVHPDTSSEDSTRVWGYALTGGGSALLAGALALYVWNAQRYDDWQQDDATLRGLDAKLAQGEPVAQNPAELRHRAADHNSLLESIERVDAAALVAAGVGAIGVGAGLYLLLHRSGGSEPAATAQLSVGPSELALRARWSF